MEENRFFIKKICGEGMGSRFIKDYWESQGSTYPDSHEASWGDKYMLDLEIKTIGQYFSEDCDVLDVGCANGYSGFRQLENCRVKSFTGVDFAESMVESAQKNKAKQNLGDFVKFEVGDVRSLRFPGESFDLVYTTRVLINLPTWQEQVQGIEECLRVTKRGGTVVFSEAFWEPLVLLNALRAIKQLPPLVEHDFNRYLKSVKLEEYLKSKQLEFKVEEFSSIYYLGSRFLRELVTDASAYPGFKNPINKIFFDIEKEFSGGGFGIQQAYVVKK